MQVEENTYTKVSSAEEAVQLYLKNSGKSKFIAGGTDVMVNKFQGNESSSHYIDISGISELKHIQSDEQYLRIGALCTLDQLKFSIPLQEEFPLLIEAANAVGSPLIRKTATLGGNILCENRCLYFNQSEWWREAIGFCLKCSGDVCIATGGKKACFSEFVSDTAPALISMRALVRAEDEEGEKILPVEELYSGDGIRPIKLRPGSLIKEILLPLGQNFRSAFRKLRLRESLEFTSLTVAVSSDMHKSTRVVLGGIDPKPVLIESKPGDDPAEIIQLALKKGRAVENDMFSRIYRRDMLGVFIQQCLTQTGNLP